MSLVDLDDRTHDHAVERQRICRLIVGEDLLSSAVKDQPALGGHDNRPQRIRVGEVPIPLRLNALHEPKRSCEKDEDGHDAPQQSVDAEGEELLIVTIYAHKSWPFAVDRWPMHRLDLSANGQPPTANVSTPVAVSLRSALPSKTESTTGTPAFRTTK